MANRKFDDTAPTPGPLTIRQSMTGDERWFVCSPTSERVALFRRKADAERFVDSAPRATATEVTK